MQSKKFQLSILKQVNLGLLITICSTIINITSLFIPWYSYSLVGKTFQDDVMFIPLEGWIGENNLHVSSCNPVFPNFTNLFEPSICIIVYSVICLFICGKFFNLKETNNELRRYLTIFLYFGPVFSFLVIYYIIIQLLINKLYFPYLIVDWVNYSQIFTVSAGFYLEIISIILQLYGIDIFKKMTTTFGDSQSFLDDIENPLESIQFMDLDENSTPLELQFKLEEDSQQMENLFLKEQTTLLNLRINHNQIDKKQIQKV